MVSVTATAWFDLLTHRARNLAERDPSFQKSVSPGRNGYNSAIMPKYLVLDSDWLKEQIENAKTLREHAQSSGKPVAIAAASVRLESLREIRKNAIPASRPGMVGDSEISLAIPG